MYHCAGLPERPVLCPDLDTLEDPDHGVWQSSRLFNMYHCAGLPERPVLHPDLETLPCTTVQVCLSVLSSILTWRPYHVPLCRTA